MTLSKLFEEHFLEISYDDENDWFYLDWKGYQSDKSIKDGINRVVELMVDRQVVKVLNDNSHTLGIWLGVSTWLVSDALPRAKKAGMTYFAHVHGPSRLSRISAEAALALVNLPSPKIQAFNDIDSAKDWLKSRKAISHSSAIR